MSREGKLAKNTFILAIGTFLPKLSAFITLPILTAYLTKEEYGIYDLVTVLVSLVLPAVTLQIQTAAFRFLIDVRQEECRVKAIVTNIFAFIIPISLAALLILNFFLPGSTEVRLLICAYFFADILVNGARQVSRGLEKNLDFSISAIISSLGKMIFAVIFVWYLRIGLTGAIIALGLSSMFSLTVLVIRAKLYRYIDLSLISRSEIRNLISYSWPMVPNAMSMWVMRVSDRFVVTMFMGLEANAVYSVANKIPSLLTLAQSTFTMAWQENASIVSRDEDADAYYSAMFRTMFDLMAGFLGLLICATPLLFKLLIRGNYAEAYAQMPVLFLGMFFYSQCAYLGGIYVAYKDTRSVGITTMAAAFCNLIVDLVAIRWIGLYAASGSTLVSYLFLFIFRMMDVRKIVRIRYDIKHILIVLGILVLESGLYFIRDPFFNVVNIVFGGVMFFVLNKTFVRAILNKRLSMINTESMTENIASENYRGGDGRVNSLDKLKVLCALLIVCIHAPFPGVAGEYLTALTRIAVPIFFMITGFFYSEHTAPRQIKKLVWLMLSANGIYFVWKTALAAIRGDMFPYWAEVFTAKSIIRLLLLNETRLQSHLWYLGAILYVVVIVTVICRWDAQKAKKLLYIAAPILLLGDLVFGKYSLLLLHREFPSILVRNWLFVGLPYFTIGMWIHSNHTRIQKKMRGCAKVKICLLIGLTAITTLLERWLLVSTNLNPARDHYLSTTFLAIAVFLFFLFFVDGGESRISRIGRRGSAWIYILHPIFISVLGAAADRIGAEGSYNYIRPIAVFIMTTVVAELLVRAQKKIYAGNG